MTQQIFAAYARKNNDAYVTILANTPPKYASA